MRNLLSRTNIHSIRKFSWGPKCEFYELAHKIIISEKRANVGELAERFETSSETLYGCLRGRTDFKPSEMQQLVHKLPEIRFASWFLSKTNFIPIERIPVNFNKLRVSESLRRTAIQMLVDASDAADQIEQALPDNRIDLREAEMIKADIDIAERATATLREHMRKIAN